MTLKRTIQRREKRKRAKARPKPRYRALTPVEQLITELALKRLESNLKLSALINRRYDR